MVSKFYNLDDLKGKINIVNADYAKLDSLNVSKFSNNGLRKESKVKYDPLNVTLIDRINVRDTVFIEFQENENEDFTIFPL